LYAFSIIPPWNLQLAASRGGRGSQIISKIFFYLLLKTFHSNNLYEDIPGVNRGFAEEDYKDWFLMGLQWVYNGFWVKEGRGKHAGTSSVLLILKKKIFTKNDIFFIVQI